MVDEVEKKVLRPGTSIFGGQRIVHKGKSGQINEVEEPRDCGVLAGTVSMRQE